MADPIQFPVSALDHHATKVFLGVTMPLLALSLATLTSRIFFKVRASLRIELEDYLMVLGFVFALVVWVLGPVIIGQCVPFSRNFLTLTEIQQITKLGVLAVPFWICSIACIKLSVACLLLRFQQNASWRMFLYILIGVTIVTSAASLLFDFLQCIPLTATWDTTIQGAKCVSKNTFRIVSNTISAINIVTDVVLSIFPLTFLHQLRRPLTEKSLVGILMAMGMTASAVSIGKAVLVREWVNAPDVFAVGFSISNLTCVELFLGITAACLPSFKPTVQRLLTSIGIDFKVNEPFSFFRSIHGTGSPANASDGPNYQSNTRSKNSMNSNNLLDSVDIADLSKQSIRPGLEDMESGSDRRKKGSGGSHESGEIV